MTQQEMYDLICYLADITSNEWTDDSIDCVIDDVEFITLSGGVEAQ